MVSGKLGPGTEALLITEISGNFPHFIRGIMLYIILVTIPAPKLWDKSAKKV